jgi:hypothetical protein
MPQWLESIWLPLAVTIVGGIVLLFVEYRTGLFAKWRASFRESGEAQEAMFVGVSLTPVSDLESPLGDWLQISREITELLKPALDAEWMGPGSLGLDRIKPVRKGTATELVFTFVPNDSAHDSSEITLSVNAEGRIISFKRQYV